MFRIPNLPDNSGNERRKSGRLACEGAKCQFGHLTDLSRGGCKVRAKKALQIPADKSVNLTLECLGASMMVPARLAVCRKSDEGGYDLCFEFQFVNEQMVSQILRFARVAADNAEVKPRKSA